MKTRRSQYVRASQVLSFITLLAVTAQPVLSDPPRGGGNGNGGVRGGIGGIGGPIQPGRGGQLPSNNPDDYDTDKYGALVAQAEQALGQAQAQLKKAAQDLKSAEAQSTQATAAVQAAQAKVVTLTSEIQTLNNEIAALNQAISNQQNQVNLAQAKQTHLNLQVNSAEATLAAAEREYAAAQATLAPLQKTATDAQNAVALIQKKVDGLTAKVNAAQQRATQLQKALDQSTALVPQLEARAKEADAIAAKAEANKDPKAGELRKIANEARKAANEAAKALADLKNQVEVANKEAVKAKEDLGLANGELRTAQGAKVAADQALAAATAQIAPKKAARDTALAARDAAKTAATQNQTQLTALTAQLATSQTQVQQKSTSVTQKQTQLNQQNAQMASLQQAAIQAAATLQNATQAKSQADANVTARTQAQVIARTRFEQVNQNLQLGLQIASRDGREEGSVDGAIEGARAGSERGQIDGQDRGTRDGSERGQIDGINRDRTQGTQQGAQVGSSEGAVAGTRDGDAKARVDGPKNGQEAGYRDGYNAAYKKAYDENYPKGVVAGTQVGAYDQGYQTGYGTGSARGKNEGETNGKRDGYNQAEQQFRGAKLNPITVSNIPEGTDREGTSGQFGEPRNWGRIHGPRNRQYPAQRLNEAFVEAFNRAFAEAAQETFDRVYREVYARVSEDAFRRAYDYSYAMDYAAERKAAYDQAYAQYYRSAYDQESSRAYNAVYPSLYQQSYASAVPTGSAAGQPVGEKEGFDRGKSDSIASETERGRKIGDSEGYQQTYATVYKSSQDASYQARVAFYQSNESLEFEGALIADSNSDDVIAPGESLSITTIVKNFGMVSQKTPVEVKIVDRSSNILAQSTSTSLVAIAGQSRVTVTRALDIKIADQAASNSREFVTVEVSQAGASLGRARLDLTVRNPYDLSRVKGPNPAIAGQENVIQFEVKNSSSRESARDVEVELVSLDGKATPTRGRINLGKLASGETKSASLAFTIPENSDVTDVGFEIRVLEGSWKLGSASYSSATSRAWSFNASAKALMLALDNSTARVSEELARRLGVSLDLFDFTVQPELSIDVLRNYIRSDKPVIIAGLDDRMSSDSAFAIGQFLREGGKLFAVADARMQNSRAGQTILEQIQSLKESDVVGLKFRAKNQFDGVEYERGKIYRSNEIPATAVIDGQALSNVRDLAARVQRGLLLLAPFDQKLSALSQAVAQGDTTLESQIRAMILHDLKREMQDTEDADERMFKKVKARTKLVLYVNTALSKSRGTAERRAFVVLQPEIKKAKNDVFGSIFQLSRVDIEGIYEPLADAYSSEIED